VAAEVGHAKDG